MLFPAQTKAVEDAVQELTEKSVEQLDTAGFPTSFNERLKAAMYRGAVPTVLKANKGKISPTALYFGVNRGTMKKIIIRYGIDELMAEQAEAA